METIIIKLTPQEYAGVCFCVNRKVIELSAMCAESQIRLDKTEKTHIAYKNMKSYLQILNNELDFYTNLASKFKELL